MKHSFKLFYLVTCAICLFSWAHGQTIDFEDAAFSEGDQIYDQFANGTCGVKFYLDNENSGLHPVIAEVGDQNNNGYFAFQGPLRSQSQCNVFNTMIDMPAANQLVACKFLTEEAGVASAPKDVVIVWETNTLQCSGYLLDIDGTEQWKVTAFDAAGNPLADITLNSSSPNAGDGLATYWSFSNVGVIKSVRLSPSGGGNFGLGLDNFSTCSLQEEICCGGGVNYQKNSDFENGMSNFTSTYDHQPTISPNSVKPREWAIVDGNDAATINPNWNIVGASSCTATDKFMLVNGRTTLSGQKVIWRNTYTLEKDKDWVFCANFKNLPACAFDVKPTVEIMAGSTVLNVANINVNPNDPCDWQLVSTPYSTQGNSGNIAITFKIRLKENIAGDGNDLGLDEISMREDLPAPAPATGFTYSIVPFNSTHYTIAARHPQIGEDCSYGWSVCELDASANCVPGTELTHGSWQNYPADETFNGYEGTNVHHANVPKGVFEYGKRYRITLTVKCPCTEVVSESQTVFAFNGSNRMANPALGQSATLDGAHIYPNPARNQFTVELPHSLDGALQVQLMNAKGQVVLTRALAAGQSSWQVALPTLAEGVYLVQLTSGEYRKTQKLIVQ